MTTSHFLSLCMIVSNEEHTLARCLASVKDAVDEIILVDTGSTDRTVDIGKKFGARIFPYIWNDDFSDARNRGIKEAKGEWILVLDADETLDAIDSLSLKKELWKTQADGLYLNILNYYGVYKEGSYFTDSSCRIFRRSPDIFFEGRIHETVTSSIKDRGGSLELGEYTILHYGYLDDYIQLKQKNERNTRLIETALVENPDDIRLRYALGSEQIQKGDYEDALGTFLEILKNLSPFDDHAPDIILKSVNLLWYFHRRQEALNLLEKGITAYPDFPELWDTKADILLESNCFQEALYSLFQSMDNGDQKKHYSSHAGAGTYLTAYKAGLIYEKIQDDVNALKYYQSTLDLKPNFKLAFDRWIHWALYRSPSPYVVECIGKWRDGLEPSQWIKAIRMSILYDKHEIEGELWKLMPRDYLPEVKDEIGLLSKAISFSLKGLKEEALRIMQRNQRRTKKMDEVLLEWCLYYDMDRGQDLHALLSEYSAIYPLAKHLSTFMEGELHGTEQEESLNLAKHMFMEAGCWEGFVRFLHSIPKQSRLSKSFPLSHFYMFFNASEKTASTLLDFYYCYYEQYSVNEKLAISILAIKAEDYQLAQRTLVTTAESFPDNPLPRWTLALFYFHHRSPWSSSLLDELKPIVIHLSN
ncbi:tetratricopeptide repeat protein [Rossellomorea vietnamensis]|uniref:Glycosyltransferase 2-like domain-containing protein n=1 Tax=Rossellomorea vietnamensis TaxID=218284 RepID=A0A0P6WN96_9BACI|nr:tetratricopeptide repeat protein [Rossellomorea vietnamensis]KPL57694.1 hypothetical protein AM506_20835 [Rossellomorea vietnamensis]